jgi:uncharacterized SAM-binding protein YcdF (DUF218 family)
MFMLWPLKLAFKIIELILSAMILYYIVSGFQVVLASDISQSATALKPASAIVVIGSAVDNSAPSADLLHRLQDGLSLYNAKLAPKILVTGTAANGQADFEKAWYEQNGVAKRAIVAVQGNNTAAQLSAVAKRVGSTPSVIIVTDALDAFWTAKVAAHDGLSAQLTPAPGSKQAAYKHIGTVLTQASAIALGRIVGFNRIFWV